MLHVMHAVGHDERADRCATDGEQLERHRFDQRLKAAAGHDVAAKDAGKQEAEAADGQH